MSFNRILKMLWLSIVYVNIVNQVYSTDAERTSLYTSCSIFRTKLVYLIINDIKKYYLEKNMKFDQSCFLESFQEFEPGILKSKIDTAKLIEENMSKLYMMDKVNEISVSNFKCVKCSKLFAKKEFLLQHYQLRHSGFLINSTNNNEDLGFNSACLGDFCNIFNCERYKEYFIDKSTLIHTNDFRSQFTKTRLQECHSDNVSSYRLSCMTLFNKCLQNRKDEIEHQADLLSEMKQFYTSYCSKIRCSNNQRTTDFNLKVSISSMSVVKMVLGYLIGIFLIIFLIVMWITRYM